MLPDTQAGLQKTAGAALFLLRPHARGLSHEQAHQRYSAPGRHGGLVTGGSVLGRGVPGGLLGADVCSELAAVPGGAAGAAAPGGDFLEVPEGHSQCLSPGAQAQQPDYRGLQRGHQRRENHQDPRAGKHERGGIQRGGGADARRVRPRGHAVGAVPAHRGVPWQPGHGLCAVAGRQ